MNESSTTQPDPFPEQGEPVGGWRHPYTSEQINPRKVLADCIESVPPAHDPWGLSGLEAPEGTDEEEWEALKRCSPSVQLKILAAFRIRAATIAYERAKAKGWDIHWKRIQPNTSDGSSPGAEPAPPQRASS